jgi:hypothetical protein
MHDNRGKCRQWLAGFAVLVLLAVDLSPAVGLPNFEGWQAPAPLQRSAGASSAAPDVDRTIHRVSTRVERGATRLLALLRTVGVLWFWVCVSVAMFFATAAVSSVIDIRMLQLRHESPGAVSRYFGHGIRTFFGLLGDRRTPCLARSLLGAALVYWLVPFDLVPDDAVMPGFVDDVIITVCAAKGFLYLCPDALIAAHAVKVGRRGRG